jgi:polysaccharide transporter, PST family
MISKWFQSRLEGRTLTKRLLSNSSWLIFDKIMRISVGMLVSTWVARYLGPSDFGSLNFILALGAVMSAIVSLGLDNLVLKELSAPQEKHGSILYTSLVLRSIAAVITIAASFAVLFLLGLATELNQILLFWYSGCFLFYSLDILELWFHSQIQSKVTVIIRSLAFFAGALIKVWMILSQAPLWTFAAVVTLEAGVGTVIVAFVFFKYHRAQKKFRFDSKLASELLNSSLPLLIATFSAMLLSKADLILINKLVSSGSAGIYSVAVRLTEVFYLLPTSLLGPGLTALAATQIQDRALFKSRISKLFTVLTWSGILVALVSSLASPFVIPLLFGEAYQEGAFIWSIYTWALVFVFSGAVRNTWCFVTGNLLFFNVVTVLTTVLNILLNWWAISAGLPTYYCAAIFVGSQAFSAIIATYWLKSEDDLFQMQLRAFNPMPLIRNLSTGKP